MRHIRTMSLWLFATLLIVAAARVPVTAQEEYRQYLALAARQEPPFLVGSFPSHFPFLFGDNIVFDDRLFFIAEGSQLWIVGDAPNSATLVRDFGSTVQANGVRPAGEMLAILDDAVLFSSFDSENTLNIWRSDGSSSGTRLLSQLVPVSATGTAFPYTRLLGTTDDLVFFMVRDSEKVMSLWRSDGSSSGTQLLHRFTEWYDNHLAVISDDGQLFLLMLQHFNSLTGMAALWISDGSVEGTRFVQSFAPGAFVRSADLVSNNLLFTTSAWSEPGINETYLWLSDGSPAGTRSVAALGDIEIYKSATAKGRLWLSSLSAGSGSQLWISDGTTAGTRLVKRFESVSQTPEQLTILNDQLYFTMNYYASSIFSPVNYDLWKSDGTEAGTLPVLTSVALGRQIVQMNNQLYFYGAEIGDTSSLYRSDGTVEGSVRFFDIPDIDIRSSYLTLLAGRYIAFKALSDGTGTEPWVSDGTASGTGLLADVNPGMASTDYVWWLDATSSAVFFGTLTSEDVFQIWAMPFTYLP